jgi:diguanylate cyclase (GGDEF)-like protein
MLLVVGTVLCSMALLFLNVVQQRRAAVRAAADEAALLSRLAAAQQEHGIAVARQELRRLARCQGDSAVRARWTGTVRESVAAMLDVEMLHSATLAHRGERATILLVDHRGRLLTPTSPAGRQGDSIVALGAESAKGEWRQDVRGGDGIRRIVAFTPVHSGAAQQFYVGVGIDRDAVERRASRDLEISIALMALFGVAVAFVAWHAVRLIVLRRTEAMHAMTRRLEAGDLDARTGLPYGSGELSDLSRALDAMASRLARNNFERERADQRVRLSEARLRAVIEASVDGIFLVDRDGRIVECNAAGRRLFECACPRDCPSCHLRGARVGTMLGCSLPSSDAPHLVESVLQRMDGSEVAVEIVLAPVRPVASERFFVATVRDITERKRSQQVLEALSITDELTGLHNRRGFESVSTRQLRLLARARGNAVLVSLDLDGLKAINDTYGHPAGDRALCELAQVLRLSFRETDVLGRLGGDEFVVLASVNGSNGVWRALGRMQRALAARNAVGDLPYTLSVSAGWARSESGGREELADLLARADRSMYRRRGVRSSLRTHGLPVPVREEPEGAMAQGGDPGRA